MPTMTRAELGIALVSALLAFVGALGGVLLGSRLDQENWENRFKIEQKRTLLEKRISASERFVIIVNKAPIVRGLQASLKLRNAMLKWPMFA